MVILAGSLNRLAGQKFPGDAKKGNSTLSANGGIAGTIGGVDDLANVAPYLLVYPADDTTNQGISVYGRDAEGNAVPSGVYLYTLNNSTVAKGGQVVLVR